MRIGVDVDGVLADFNKAFIERVKRETGRDLFGEGYVPTTWNYPESVGYTSEETSKVWQGIEKDGAFWLTLPPYHDAMIALERLRLLAIEHDLYFITSRPGVKAKHQTEVWLATHSGDFMWNPTVLISSAKGACADALKLDCYIDDKIENCMNVMDSTYPKARVFIMDRPWNDASEYRQFDRAWTRVSSVEEFLDEMRLPAYKEAA